MDRLCILRLLRIAFSAVCGIVCLLLIVLWIRSYWWQDFYSWRLSDNRFSLTASGRGWILLSFYSYNPGFEYLQCLHE